MSRTKVGLTFIGIAAAIGTVAIAGRSLIAGGGQAAAPARPAAARQAPRAAAAGATPVDVKVHEGTSMSVAVSPDGRTLAVDLQGTIWTVPASGGELKPLMDPFNDAHQPMWSPDGKWITFFGYRDGGYDVWVVAPDGSNMHKLTWGPFDDREPIYSHDGTRVAFSSDRGERPVGSNYNIWMLDTRSGELKQLTKNAADDYMPTWSPDDKEIAFVSTRDNTTGIYAVDVASGTERKVVSAPQGGRLDSPSWSPNGKIVYHVLGNGTSQLFADGQPLTGDENAFAFRVSWASPTDFYYVSDGQIRKRSLGGASAQTIAFNATLHAIRPMTAYKHRRRDFDSTAPRQALGIVRPMLSPDGKQIAFAAVGDIYVMPVGGKPVNVTKDEALDTDPAWSPDGSQLVYSSDKDSPSLQLWIRDMKTGQSRKVTNIENQPQGASWSPDGKRIAFFGVDGMWRVADMEVLDIASGKVTQVHDTLPQPGSPVWSPDGKRLAIAGIAPYSRRFREGTNQVLTMSSEAPGSDKWFAPLITQGVDSRGGGGVVWSPDGTRMAGIYDGVLAVWRVGTDGQPLEPPRHVTTESANSPSFAGDSKHILYQSLDKLRIVDIETGDTRTVPVDLKYTPAIPTGRIVVHAGKLADMKSPNERSNVDIVIVGNRIRSVVPHSDANHAGGEVVDASNLTVMPGLTEFHSHLQKDFGAAQGRAWLAFGITTVRSPGNTPYEAVEDREANEAGVRPGPRVYGTGYLMEWQREYYKMGIAISTVGQFEMELQRAKVLQHDLIKSYVRLPDLQQKRMVEFAHSIGIPVATHEIYPSSLVGVDVTEHTGATSRRGYSMKIATLSRAYQDVIALLGQGQRIFTPMISGGGVREMFTKDPALKNDPRFKLYTPWIQALVARQPQNQNFGGGDPRGGGKMVVDAMHAGALVVAGTDEPIAAWLHGELTSYVMAGMTPYEALRCATVNPGIALGQDTGTIEAGKLADIIMVQGDPLADIANARNVKKVIANGRLYDVDQLVKGPVGQPKTTTAAQ